MAAPAGRHATRRPNLKDHSREALRELFGERGWPAYRADQVATLDLCPERRRRDPGDVERARRRSATRWPTSSTPSALDVGRDPALGRRHAASSCSGRFDGARDRGRADSQRSGATRSASRPRSAARSRASFCATGALGFTRNLSTAEIIDQVLLAMREMEPDTSLTNLVFMGMGEPLLNLPAVSEAIRILTDPKAFALAPRRVTVSTSGVLPQIGSAARSRPDPPRRQPARDHRRSARRARSAQQALPDRRAPRDPARGTADPPPASRSSSSTR